MFRIKVGMFYW